MLSNSNISTRKPTPKTKLKDVKIGEVFKSNVPKYPNLYLKAESLNRDIIYINLETSQEATLSQVKEVTIHKVDSINLTVKM